MIGHSLKKIHIRSNVRRWKNKYHANTNQKKVGVAILISGRAEIKSKETNKNKFRDKEEHSIMMTE